MRRLVALTPSTLVHPPRTPIAPLQLHPPQVPGLVALPAGDALVQGLRAVAPQPAGWDTASAGVLTAKDLFVTDSTHAVIVISQLSSYDILFAEEVLP